MQADRPSDQRYLVHWIVWLRFIVGRGRLRSRSRRAPSGPPAGVAAAATKSARIRALKGLHRSGQRTAPICRLRRRRGGPPGSCHAHNDPLVSLASSRPLRGPGAPTSRSAWSGTRLAGWVGSGREAEATTDGPRSGRLRSRRNQREVVCLAATGGAPRRRRRRPIRAVSCLERCRP